MADNQHRIFRLLDGKRPQMLLHDVQMVWLPEPVELLLVVINRRLKEIDFWRAGQQRFTISVPGGWFPVQF